MTPTATVRQALDGFWERQQARVKRRQAYLQRATEYLPVNAPVRDRRPVDPPATFRTPRTYEVHLEPRHARKR